MPLTIVHDGHTLTAPFSVLRECVRRDHDLAHLIPKSVPLAGCHVSLDSGPMTVLNPIVDPSTGTVLLPGSGSTGENIAQAMNAWQTATGQAVSAPAHQQAASSWARGSTVQVCYDPADPERFVLAGPTSRSHLVANVIVGALVVAIMAGTILAMIHVWSEFRYDRAGRPDSAPVTTTRLEPGTRA